MGSVLLGHNKKTAKKRNFQSSQVSNTTEAKNLVVWNNKLFWSYLASRTENNPDSPYGVYMVPPLDGERPSPFAHGLQKDEAIVQIAVTPPKSKYSEMIEHLKNVQRCNKMPNGETRTYIQASLSDPIKTLPILM